VLDRIRRIPAWIVRRAAGGVWSVRGSASDDHGLRFGWDYPIGGYRAMYYACRVDYPCEGCEQPRLMAARNAWGWAWRYMR